MSHRPFSVFVRLYEDEATALAFLAHQDGLTVQEMAYHIVSDELRQRGLLRAGDDEYFKTPNDALIVERK